MIKRVITSALICFMIVLSLAGCDNSTININIENDSTINGTTFGTSALSKIGGGLWYDTTTRIVYWWNGSMDYSRWDTTPSPYYAPNGFPYRYNPETNTFEEIKEDKNAS